MLQQLLAKYEAKLINKNYCNQLERNIENEKKVQQSFEIKIFALF